MKTQISRTSRQVSKKYSSVCHQQGRMLTDSDLTEQALISRDRLNLALRDIIGSGTPRQNALLQLTQSGDKEIPSLHWGVVYVDGVPAEVVAGEAVEGGPPIDADIFDYSHQLFYPETPVLPTASAYRLYLDVWDRAVTWLEDEALRDPGLHGADTTTRTQTMAQVKWCDTDTQPLCPQVNPAIGDARLQLTLRSLSSSADECDPCSEELELHDPVGNYLFRVEVHDVHYIDPLPPQKRDKDHPVLPDAVVLKWSSENGAEAYRAADVPADFSSNQYVYEFFDDTDEKHLGVHLARDGANGRIIDGKRADLVDAFPTSPPAGKNYVRRWDGYCKLLKNGADWQLESGFEGNIALKIGANKPGDVKQGGDSVSIELRLITLLMELSDFALVAGDYWLAPVRESIHQQGEILLEGEESGIGAAPQGEQHHYMLLVDVAADGLTMTLPEGIECDLYNACQLPQFPTLTDLQAGDICYDNEQCLLPEVTTVQDALDHLCQENDLPWHNKYLHGWGVVCGLMLECDSKNPDSVILNRGYALDCDGRDMVINDEMPINIPEYLDKAGIDPATIDKDQGICLYLEHTDQQTLDVGLELYESDQSSLRDRLEETLLYDFYQDCILDLFETLKGELQNTDVETRCASTECGKKFIPSLKRRTLALTNIVFHKNQIESKSVLNVSPCEHALLKDLYDKLKENLSSKTFCSQFQNEGFPAYPFKGDNNCRATWFTPELLDHLQLHPNGKLLFGWQRNSSRIFIFRQSERGCSGDLLGYIDIPQLDNGDITDFVIDAKNTIHISAIIHQEDTLFARTVLDINRLKGCEFIVNWETSFICGVRIVKLAQSPWSEKHLFAVELCKGIYLLDREELFAQEKITKEPHWAFPASGHIDFDLKSDLLFATAFENNTAVNFKRRSEQNCKDGFYNRIVFFNGKRIDNPQQPNIAVPVVNTSPVQGVDGFVISSSAVTEADLTDDIIVNPEKSGFVLYLVANEGNKKILCRFDAKGFESTGENRQQWAGVKYHSFDEAGHIALRYVKNDKLNGVLASRFSKHDLQYIPGNLNPRSLARGLLTSIPVQAGPIDIVSNDSIQQVFVLNHFGQSLTVLNYNFAVYQKQRVVLDKYRDDVVNAFFHLLSGLVQYLKDCFCQHLLVACPQCDEEEKVYLGCLSMNDDDEVHHICNFTKRKFVKSFPTVSYWLSLIPIAPVVAWLVEEFCCLVLPNFARQQDSRALSINPFQLGMSKAIINADQSNMLTTFSSVGQTMLRKGLTNVVGAGYKDKRSYEELTLQEYNYKAGVYAAKIQKVDNAVLLERIDVIDDERLISKGNVSTLEEKVNTLTSEKTEAETRIATLEADKIKSQQEATFLKTELTAIKNEKEESDQRFVILEKNISELSISRNELEPIIAGAKPVSSIDGISAENVRILEKNNIFTVNILAMSDPEKLKQIGVNSRTATSLIKKAKNRISLKFR